MHQNNDNMSTYRCELIQLIVNIFLNIRLHYVCKSKDKELKLRQKCKNLILFRNE